MANQEHVDLLKQGIEAWNDWKREHPSLKVDLSWTDGTNGDFSGADLSGAILLGAKLRGANIRRANLSGANLSGADLSNADLSNANLSNSNLNNADLFHAQLIGTQLRGTELKDVNLSSADLSNADLSGVNLHEFNLRGANLSGANLSGTNLNGASLDHANLSGADLSGADLSRATLIETNFAEATLTNCHIYGIAAWNVELRGAKQNNLVITPEEEPTITVDNLKIAQFIYLLLNNTEIRDAIDTIARKAVLILGRFTPERKAVLDALREALRTQGYLPILFDFEKPGSRNFTETVRTLAHLSRFIIADLTDPSSIPQELYAIVPTLAVPVRPVLLEGKREYWGSSSNGPKNNDKEE
jgi:uncharacterized protein YjbI with pentapeptide repeats